MSNKKQQNVNKVEAKIIIDTNKLLEILEYWTIDDINKYLGQSNAIIFTEQIYEEFLRNSEKVKNWCLTKEIFIDDLKKYGCNKEIVKDIENINKDISQIKEKIRINFNNKRSILCAIIKNKVVVNTTEEIIKKARLRKEKGNPPSSGTSIGDEIIWESLLNLNDNIIIVTKDNTWSENEYFLKTEYEYVTKKQLIKFESKLDKAKDLIGEQDKMLEELERRNSFAQFPIFYDIAQQVKYYNNMINNIISPIDLNTINSIYHTLKYLKNIDDDCNNSDEDKINE